MIDLCIISYIAREYTGGGWETLQFTFYTDYYSSVPLTKEQLIVRSHDKYRGEHSWRDWVMVRWECNDARRQQPERFRETRGRLNDCYPDFGDNIPARNKTSFGYSPARVLAFFECEARQWAYVEPCEFRHIRSSTFTTEWQLEVLGNERERKRIRPNLAERTLKVKRQLIPVETIIRQVLMIPYSLKDYNNMKYHEVWPRVRWSGEFTNSGSMDDHKLRVNY